jgi:hypothetical protein
MSTEEFLLELAVGLVGAAIGWLARGILAELQRRRDHRAWRRARLFLSSRNSKSQ